MRRMRGMEKGGNEEDEENGGKGGMRRMRKMRWTTGWLVKMGQGRI